MSDSKVCKVCGETKPLDEFNRNRSYSDGRVSFCRPCLSVRRKAQSKALGRNNVGDVITIRCADCSASFEWVQARGASPFRCQPCQADADRKSKRSKYRKADLKRHYGITIEQYDAMVIAQNDRCLICEATEPGGRHRSNWYVDHDHDTGAVRGLLCCNCNVGVGMFRDDPALLRRAAEYLER